MEKYIVTCTEEIISCAAVDTVMARKKKARRRRRMHSSSKWLQKRINLCKLMCYMNYNYTLKIHTFVLE
jgi:hypothetical protein